MIVYQSGIFGINNLFRAHGSPVYKVAIPTATSTLFLLALAHVDFVFDDRQSVLHPYSIGAFIGFFSFLLTFRLNFAYNRYWEAATAVHHMLSKWLDVAMTLAAWHYQAHCYDDIKPPAFGLNPLATPEAMPERPHAIQPTWEETRTFLVDRVNQTKNYTSWYDRFKPRLRRLNELEKQQRAYQKQATKGGEFSVRSQASVKNINNNCLQTSNVHSAIPIPLRFRESMLPPTAGKGTEKCRPPLTKQRRGSLKLTRTRPARMPAPSLFLQELAHLTSLLSATAMSTLRNDIEMAESPLAEYIPGQPWPHMDPDQMSQDERRQYDEGSMFWTVAYYMLGLSRSEKHRTLYNAVRPFSVLGGVSDREIELLQNARGPYAKTALCFMWLQEFISRETLLGSTGDINGAILSRLFQYQSDGMVGYNQARKIAYVPFPFVNAQMISFFSLSIIFMFPFLYYSFVNQLWFACFMNTLTVMCFLGLHEVARELENPFINVPNDLPLCTFQAQFNEALGTMFSGYHPDSWFAVEDETKSPGL